jgi:hypothetical protein
MRCPFLLLLVFAIRLALFEFAKAPLGIHQALLHLLVAGDFLRHNLAGTRIDLATSRRNLGLRPMRYGTSPAQFRQCLLDTGSLLLRQTCLALRPQAALHVHFAATVACSLPRQYDTRHLARLALFASYRRRQ